MIELDGSFGEGGGQILRTSLALSLLTGQAFHLANVRANRARPGLQPQHLMSVQAAAQVGRANTRGASLRSSDLVFEPGKVVAGTYLFRIGTAGATGLVVHTVYLPLALAGPSTVTVEGGTHVEKSPCFHFLAHTWQPYLALVGLDVRVEMKRAGFYPRGGGLVKADIAHAVKPKPLRLTEVIPPTSARVLSAVSGGLPEEIAERQTRQACKRLRGLGLAIERHDESWVGGTGTMLGVELDTRPVPTFFFALGARGKRAEAVADEAVEQVEQHLTSDPTGVDSHTADQLLLPLALAPGPSEYRVACVSRHLLTNAAIIRRFVDREIVCNGAEGEPGDVRIA